MARKKQSSEKPQEGSRSRGPNWTTSETLLLSQAWRTELDLPAEKGESSTLLNSRIFERFKGLCGGTTPRSEKAVIDKKNNLPIAFKLIVSFNSNRIIGSTGQPNWFELSQEQKKAIKAVNKTDAQNADMDITVFNALKNVLGGDDSVEPSVLMSSTPIFEKDYVEPTRQHFYMSLGNDVDSQVAQEPPDTSSTDFARDIPSSPESLLDASFDIDDNVPVNDAPDKTQTSTQKESSITGQQKRKQISQPTNDQRFLMNLVEAQSDAMTSKLDALQEDRRAARRQRVKERQENRAFQERERERDRELLRALFGRRDYTIARPNWD